MQTYRLVQHVELDTDILLDHLHLRYCFQQVVYPDGQRRHTGDEEKILRGSHLGGRQVIVQYVSSLTMAYVTLRLTCGSYLYGGAGIPPNTTGFDDVYILTLPSFIWIKWWPAQPGAGKPHNSLTCNVIDNSQMLIIGGTFPLTDECDSPNTWGVHNLNLGKNGPQKSLWDLYYPNTTTYAVPQEIVARIGGG